MILCMYLKKVIMLWIWSAQSFCFYFCFFRWENLPNISIEVTALYNGMVAVSAITSKFLRHLDPFPIVCDILHLTIVIIGRSFITILHQPWTQNGQLRNLELRSVLRKTSTMCSYCSLVKGTSSRSFSLFSTNIFEEFEFVAE